MQKIVFLFVPFLNLGAQIRCPKNWYTNLKSALDQHLQGPVHVGVYLDLQKTFDTVNQNILLAKLKQGIKGTSLDWFKSFIYDRVQYTSVDLKESSIKIISHGIPQGSVLDHLLFIIFINDLNNSVKNSKVHHYADDTNLLLTEKSLKKINKQVNQDLA